MVFCVYWPKSVYDLGNRIVYTLFLVKSQNKNTYLKFTRKSEKAKAQETSLKITHFSTNLMLTQRRNHQNIISTKRLITFPNFSFLKNIIDRGLFVRLFSVLFLFMSKHQWNERGV